MRKLPIRATMFFAACCVSHAPTVAGERSRTVIVYGDSISLGTGSTPRAARGWPDELKRLLDRRGEDWTVVNRAINGNGLVWRTSCFGEPALARFRFDRHSIGRGDTIVLMAGVNDLIQPRLPNGYSTCFKPANLSASTISKALAELRQELRVSGQPRLLLATIPPFGRSEFHSAAAERDRQQLNTWIRTNWPKGDVIDLDRILGSGNEVEEMMRDYDSGDGLHPGSKGHAAIAAAVAEKIL